MRQSNLSSLALRTAALLGTFCASLAAPLTAQCESAWTPQPGLTSTSGIVNSLLRWDPDGAGPLPPGIVAGGKFYRAGNIAADQVAFFDPNSQEWSNLGAGLPYQDISTLARAQNGDLLAASKSSFYSGKVFRWDGSSWASLGSVSMNLGQITSLIETTSGLLLAGHTGATGASRVASYNGTNWTPLGTLPHSVHDLVQMPNGDTLAALSSGPGGVVKWDGTNWTPLGNLQGPCRDLELLANGDLVAAGYFQSPSMLDQSVARWDGTSWQAVGTFSTWLPTSITELGNGELVTAEYGGVLTHWNGTTWTQLGQPVSNGTGNPAIVNCVIADGSGSVVIGTNGGGLDRTSSVMQWNGSDWLSLTPGFDANIRAIAHAPNGDVIVGGNFHQAGSIRAKRVARFDGNNWHALGYGIHGQVDAVVALPNGDIVVGGEFTSAGSTAANNIARWDGTNWHAMGAGSTAAVTSMTVRNGRVIAPITSAQFVVDVAEWDGSAWQTMMTSISITDIEMQDGILVVGTADGVSRFDGSAWTTTTQLGGLKEVALLPNGDLLAGGYLILPNVFSGYGFMRWDGSAWNAFAPTIHGDVRGMTVLPNGDLIAAGSFAYTGTTLVNNIVRFDGSSWSAMDNGTLGVSQHDGAIHALSLAPDGELWVGGQFLTAGGLPAAHLARWAQPCPPSVVPYGTGCAGANGVDTLVATHSPWAGGTYRGTATGLPTVAFSASVFGFTQLAAPLASVFPVGPTGCTILASADHIDFGVTTTGSLNTSLALPNVPALAGQIVNNFVVSFEFDAQGTITAITNTNALQLTVGTY